MTQITQLVSEHEAFYQLHNTLKTYRTRSKLFVYKNQILKKHSNMELNTKLSPTEKGHSNLTPQELQAKNAINQIRSVRRSRTKISDIIEMNDFEWFGTFTTSPKMLNRYDDALVKQRVSKTLQNMQRFYRFEYLLIPERHKDKALHFHALLTRIPDKWLQFSGKCDKKGRKIFNLKPYKIGFTNFSKIDNLEATAKYCAKYVQKALDDSDNGKKRYWHSKRLKKPQIHENVDPIPYQTHETATTHATEHYTSYEIQQKILPP